MKNKKKYHNVRTFTKSNRKIVERCKICTSNTQIPNMRESNAQIKAANYWNNVCL